GVARLRGALPDGGQHELDTAKRAKSGDVGPVVRPDRSRAQEVLVARSAPPTRLCAPAGRCCKRTFMRRAIGDVRVPVQRVARLRDVGGSEGGGAGRVSVFIRSRRTGKKEAGIRR